MIERLRISATNRPVDVIAHWREAGYLEMSPPYQRGDVWGTIRQTNLIRSILIGIPIPSIIVNDRFSAQWGNEIAVIDGKQRMTAVLRFMDSELQVPGEWFGRNEALISYAQLSETHQRRFRQQPIPFAEGQLSSLDAEREVFELVNFGGVPQGETDIP